MVEESKSLTNHNFAKSQNSDKKIKSGSKPLFLFLGVIFDLAAFLIQINPKTLFIQNYIWENFLGLFKKRGIIIITR